MRRHHHPESVTSLQQTYPWQLPLFWPQKFIHKPCLFTFINDENGEMRLTTCMRSCTKFKSWDWNEFSRIQNPAVLLVKKFFVCWPIDTRDSEVDSQRTQFWCVKIKNQCISTCSDTANICCVHDTACPAEETIFPCVAIFWELALCNETKMDSCWCTCVYSRESRTRYRYGACSMYCVLVVCGGVKRRYAYSSYLCNTSSSIWYYVIIWSVYSMVEVLVPDIVISTTSTTTRYAENSKYHSWYKYLVLAYSLSVS